MATNETGSSVLDHEHEQSTNADTITEEDEDEAAEGQSSRSPRSNVPKPFPSIT